MVDQRYVGRDFDLDLLTYFMLVYDMQEARFEFAFTGKNWVFFLLTNHDNKYHVGREI